MSEALKDTPVNFSNPEEKSRIAELVGTLEGRHRVTIIPWKQRRTDRQNRYYWPCFVVPFADYLRDQGEAVTDDEAHAILKDMFLRVTVCDPKTGLAFERTRSTTELSTVEFNEYLDRVAAWLADTFHFKVPEPGEYREPHQAAEESLA